MKIKAKKIDEILKSPTLPITTTFFKLKPQQIQITNTNILFNQFIILLNDRCWILMIFFHV